jgi:hypothetical protein
LFGAVRSDRDRTEDCRAMGRTGRTLSEEMLMFGVRPGREDRAKVELAEFLANFLVF